MSSAADRRWKRVKLDVRVKLWRGDAGERGASVMRSFELSEGGMSLYTPEPMDIGTLVGLSFTLPGAGEMLRLHAVVRNQHGFRCGLEFVRVSEAARVKLARYVGSVEGAPKGGSASASAKA